MQTESPKKSLTEKIGERKLKKAAATSCGEEISSPSLFMNKSPAALNHQAPRNDLKKHLLGRSGNSDDFNSLDSTLIEPKLSSGSNYVENKVDSVKKKRAPKSSQISNISSEKAKLIKSKKKALTNDVAQLDIIDKFADSEPIYEEDIIDNFAILSFKTVDELEFISGQKIIDNNSKKTKSKPRKKPLVKTDKCKNKEKSSACELNQSAEQLPNYQKNSISNIDSSLSTTEEDHNGSSEYLIEPIAKRDDIFHPEIPTQPQNSTEPNLQEPKTLLADSRMNQHDDGNSLTANGYNYASEEDEKMSEMESEPFKSLKRKSAERLSIVQRPEQDPEPQTQSLPSIVDQQLPVNALSPSKVQVNDSKPTVTEQLSPQPGVSSVTGPVTEAIAIAPFAQKSLPKDVKSNDSIVNHAESPAIAATGGQCPAYTPLYAPYMVRSPLTAPSPATAIPVTTAAVVPVVSATQDTNASSIPTHQSHPLHQNQHQQYKDIYRNQFVTAQPTLLPPSTISGPTAFSRNSAWSPAVTPTRSGFVPQSIFAPPTPVLGPNSFGADQLFSTNQAADVLRRELDSRFLASQDRTLNLPTHASFLRGDIHQHQHHHTHVHQHTTTNPLIAPAIFPSPLMLKDIRKLCPVNSPFAQSDLGIPAGYSAYPTNPLLHSSTNFVAPTPQFPSTFQPKKHGKWNAMHVRIAWEVYYHQQKYPMDAKSVSSSVVASNNPKMETLRQSQILVDPNHSMFRPPQQPSEHQHQHPHIHSHSHPHLHPHVQSNNHDISSQLPQSQPPSSNTTSNGPKSSHELPFSTALRKFESQAVPTSSSNGFHMSSVANSDSDSFLKQLNDFWIRYSQQMLLIRGVFLFLDRKFVLRELHKLSIWDMGLETFSLNMIKKSSAIANKLTDGLLSMVERERRGELIDRSLIQSLLRMLRDTKLYSEIFEVAFLLRTDRWYLDESRQLIAEYSIIDYLKYVDRRLNEEKERLEQYLDSSTESDLIRSVESHLVKMHVQTILSNGFNGLMDANEIDALELLYELLSRVENGLVELCAAFCAYIKNYGRDIVIDPQKDKSMVENLLAFKDKLDKIISLSFQGNTRFFFTLKDAFENFINQRPNKPAELIAKYIDSKLKAGYKELSEREMEQSFDNIMLIFRFIHGKDVFEAFYKKDLAKRLLVGKSASVDAEKSMISKFKHECGSEFTSKLEGMFKDIELSKDFNATYKQQVTSRALSDTTTIDLSVSVLTMSYWPSYQVMNVTLPPEMVRLQESFTRFYISKYCSKKLQWQSMLGHCVLKAQFNQGQKILEVSQFQALVLLLFNTTRELTLQEIQSLTNIDDRNLRRTLQSLACGKVRVLLKVPKGRDVNDNDKFQYNGQFTNKYYRIKINQIQLKETAEEQKATEERAFQVTGNNSSFSRFNSMQHSPYPIAPPTTMPSHTFLPPARSQQPQQATNLPPQGSNNQFYHPHHHQHHHHNHNPNVLTSTANNSFVPVAPPIQMSHENSPWSRQQHVHLQPAHNNNLRPTGSCNSTAVGSHFGVYNGKQFVPSDSNYPMMGPSNNTLLLEQQRRELEEQQHRAAVNAAAASAAATAKKEKEERDEKHRRQLEKEKEKRLMQQQQQQQQQQQHQQLQQQRYYESTRVPQTNVYRDRSPLKSHSNNVHSLDYHNIKEEPYSKKEGDLLRHTGVNPYMNMNMNMNHHTVPLPYPSSNPYLDAANRSAAVTRHILSQPGPTASIPHSLPLPSNWHLSGAHNAANPFHHMDPLRYNTLAMAEAYNQEHAKLFGAYAAAVSQHPFAVKEQLLQSLRMPSGSVPGSGLPHLPSSSGQLIKKENIHR